MATSKPARPGLENPREQPPYGRFERDAGAPDAPQAPVGDTCGPLGHGDLGTPTSGRTRSDTTEATVWATRTGEWTQDHSSGWGYIFAFHGLKDLVASMTRAGLSGRVAQLAIVAHGDQDGRVVLDRDLTPDGVLGEFSSELADLRRFLTPDGLLAFYSCIAGKGEDGSALLANLSNALPGRTIVGFVLYGYIGPSGAGNRPGVVEADEDQNLPPRKKDALGYLDPWCRWAKRARNGQIVHIPITEQNVRPGKRCANPKCPGHDNPADSCRGW